ncbi:MAG: ribosomal large subunit pseudouridine synthase rRNA synthase [Candidatus Parcubacteria bacterium]|jgi:23S rRNA pseudouridine1911/1915/1917 synthase
MNPEIIFQNEDLMVINKPAGLMVHDSGHSSEHTVATWFLTQVPAAKGVGEPQLSQKGEPLERSGIVHRLDKETSGVMILAKKQQSFEHLKKQFHDRLVKKEYRAFVYGAVRERWGTIERPIGRSTKDFRLRSAQHGARGLLRPATTQWECIGTGRYNDELFSYMKLRPKTGRTHQLRVHLQAIGRPIVGDLLYAKAEMEKSGNLDFNRLALHAHSLELDITEGQSERFIAPLPSSFEEAAEKIAEIE